MKTRRTAYALRDFVELTVAMREIGVMDTREAASALRRNGIELQTALRLLAGRG